jgi:hypothetical protein
MNGRNTVQCHDCCVTGKFTTERKYTKESRQAYFVTSVLDEHRVEHAFGLRIISLSVSRTTRELAVVTLHLKW